MCPEEEAGLDPSHPRYRSLLLRERLVFGFRAGIVVPEGLIAHGRGEMFDYLLGEETLPPALIAEQAAAAALLTAKKPVISVNGNFAALCVDEIVSLSEVTGARVEVNLFHWTEDRAACVGRFLESRGAKSVLAEKPDTILKGVHSDRGKCHREGIWAADVILVPLEDGDRTIALAEMGKKVISIDLNPLSRTSLAAAISIVDDVTRAMPNIIRFSEDLKGSEDRAKSISCAYDNSRVLKSIYAQISERFGKLARE